MAERRHARGTAVFEMSVGIVSDNEARVNTVMMTTRWSIEADTCNRRREC
jgi:hypothetical protein